MFDRIVAELPTHEYHIASAHLWKVQCFEILKQYDDAIRECQEVMKFPRYDNLTNQIRDKEQKLKALAQQTRQQKED